jgi:hypothetical protein
MLMPDLRDELEDLTAEFAREIETTQPEWEMVEKLRDLLKLHPADCDLDELERNLERSVMELDRLAAATNERAEMFRLHGKAEGVNLALGKLHQARGGTLASPQPAEPTTGYLCNDCGRSRGGPGVPHDCPGRKSP